MKASALLLILILILILSGCYNYYFESRTPDYATQTDFLRGGRPGQPDTWRHSSRVDSGVMHMYRDAWNDAENLGQKIDAISLYLNGCPDFVLGHCGIPEEYRRKK